MPRTAVAIVTLLGLLAATAFAVAAKPREEEPETVGVIHVLIGFKKTVRGKKLDRTKREAEELAYELLERAQAGEDFVTLVQEYSDDYKPQQGVVMIRMTNDDQPLRAGHYPRREMAANFGDVAFGLEVDEVGIARYHPGNSPFGFHVIKRLE